MIESKRFTIVESEFFDVSLEYSDSFAILHLHRIDKFTKDILIELAVRLDQWWEFLSTVGYGSIHAGIAPENERIKKLLLKLGFKFLGKGHQEDVGDVDIYGFTGEGML